MKRISLLIAGSLLASTIFTSTASASDLKMNVNGKAVKFNYGTPFIESGSSLLPLRDLLVSLGVTNDNEHIIWDGKTKSVTIKYAEDTVKLTVGMKEIYKNGTLFRTLEVPAKMADGRVYLPARAVAEALGNKVSFDAKSGTVLVNSSDTSSFNIENLKTLVPKATNNDVQISDTIYQIIANNKDLFWGSKKELRSLETTLNDPALAKIVKRISFKIDAIKELTLDDGSMITVAIVHSGGEISPITNKWVEETYYQILYVGKTTLQQGGAALADGLILGKSTISLTNQLGVDFQAPLNVLFAGNFYGPNDYLNDIKESTPSSITIDGEKPPTTDEQTLKSLTVDLLNDKVTLSTGKSIRILNIEIGSYFYKPLVPIDIKEYSEVKFDLALLKNSSGESFKPNTDDPYNAKLITSVGETTKSVHYNSTSSKAAGEIDISKIDNGQYTPNTANTRDEIKSSMPDFKTLNPAITDDITTLNSIYSKISAIAENSNTSKLYSLQNDEVLLLLTIGDENAATDFKMLSSSGKKTLMKSFVKYGDIAGYDHCNTYVIFGNQVLAFADIDYEKSAESISVSSNNPLPARK